MDWMSTRLFAALKTERGCPSAQRAHLQDFNPAGTVMGKNPQPLAALLDRARDQAVPLVDTHIQDAAFHLDF